MRMLLGLLAMIVLAPAAAQARPAGWLELGRADYPRADYGRSGPTPLYYAPDSYVMYAPPGPHSYRYRNGVRVWYGAIPAFAPVLTTGASVRQGPAVAAPASPGPRVYRAPNGVRIWYGQ
ncbi:MAG: hypothetical protein JSS00_14830 [Proteobacteria bacterium]|nr:hypothetical protein [Pseudomonadota bacterium]